jgi:hypothetical protein
LFQIKNYSDGVAAAAAAERRALQESIDHVVATPNNPLQDPNKILV